MGVTIPARLALKLKIPPVSRSASWARCPTPRSSQIRHALPEDAIDITGIRALWPLGVVAATIVDASNSPPTIGGFLASSPIPFSSNHVETTPPSNAVDAR
jgi:hypothetical protein